MYISLFFSILHNHGQTWIALEDVIALSRAYM